MPAYTHITIERSHQDKIATITMRRPEVHNAFNAQLIQDLQAAFTELSTDTRLHAVILTGDGPSFSAGADLNMMKASATFTQEQNLDDALRLADLFDTINTFPCPVVARVNGTAMGGGLGLLARVLFVTGERFSAARAREIGLVHIVTTAEELDAAVEKTVSELVSSGPQAIRACKALALNVGHMDHERVRRYTAETIATLRVSAEAQGRLRAFLEKR